MRVVVHLHLFYLNMWKDFEFLLKNLSKYNYDLFVTLVKDDVNIRREIIKFKSDVKIEFVENRGYDVGPFFYFLENIDLNKYDYVIKLHSKNKRSQTIINSRKICNGYWFKLLGNALIGSRKIVEKNFFQFASNPKIGMIGSKYLITKLTPWCKQFDVDISSVMTELGFNNFLDTKFVAGTMFIVKADLLKLLKCSNFSIKSFPSTSKVKDGTLAHVMERVLGAIIIAQGYEICGFDKNIMFECLSCLYTLKLSIKKIFYSFFKYI